MDEKATKVIEYKRAYSEFIKALNYINTNIEALSKDPARLKKIKDNFIDKFEKPLDKAWDELDKTSKNRFATVYVKSRKDRSAQLKELNDCIDLWSSKNISAEIVDIGDQID